MPTVRSLIHVPVGQRDQKLGDHVHSLPSSRLKIDFQDILRQPNLAGRLLHFLPNWRQISSDPDILMTVAGYKLPFTSPPHQVDRLYPGCISRAFALSQFTTVETPSSLSGQELRFPDTTLNRGHRRTSMVASTSRCLERSSAPSPIPRSNNRDRRVSDGLGVVCQGVRTGGVWSQMEQKLHINCLELLAGSFTIKSFTKNRLCVHVRLRMVYLNRLGGTRSLVLSNLALALWEWALTRNIFLSAEHIAGNLNVSADWESRNFLDSSNWKLCPEIFRSLMQIRGPCTIDLFADRLNCQLPQFCSWKPDPMALATDAFQQNWSNGRNYAFPTFCLIMRCLAKLRAEGGELILVTPVWPTQAWYPSILHMLIAPPVLLPWTPKLLCGPQGQSHPLVVNHTLPLAAWHVCANPCKREELQETLPSSAWQTLFITPPGTNGIAGVTSGKLIRFVPLWQI